MHMPMLIYVYPWRVHTFIVWRDALRKLRPFSSRPPSRKLRAKDLCILFYYNIKDGFIISQTPMQTHEIFKNLFKMLLPSSKHSFDQE